MNRELEKNPLYSAGAFWSGFGVLSLDVLKSYGVENFKRTVSHTYQNWLMCTFEDAQVRRLLSTWAEHGRIEPFVNSIEVPDHVGWHGAHDFEHGREYALAHEKEREIYRLAVGLLWERVLQSDKHGLLASLEELEVGNPVRIHRQGRLISSDLAHSVRERSMVLDHLKLSGKEGLVVGELGAGYGRLAEVFGRTTNYRYFIFDIAPALYVSEWYVRRIFPGEKVFGFRPFTRWEEVRDEVASSRFAFFTANQIEQIPDGALDIFINMNSLQEMRMEQIRNFLRHISRLTKRAFLSRQYLRWHNYRDHVTVSRDDFALGEGWKKTLDSVDDIHPDFFNEIWERA
jgi:putative sugar O-methyltransferase